MSDVSPAEYETRIRALEKQCATLAAEVDRMRLIVDTAFDVYYGRRPEQDLGLAIRAYETAREQGDGQR